jgi:hypothetical protein
MPAADKTKLRFRSQDRTLRRVMTHLARETTRPVGHLAQLREFADGDRGE